MRPLQIAFLLLVLSPCASWSCDLPDPTQIDGGVYLPTPESMQELLLACVPLEIFISFIVLEDGTTDEVEVFQAKPDGIDVSVAVEVIKRLQFEPIIVDGAPVKSCQQVRRFAFNPLRVPRCESVTSEDSPPHATLERTGDE